MSLVALFITVLAGCGGGEGVGLSLPGTSSGGAASGGTAGGGGGTGGGGTAGATQPGQASIQLTGGVLASPCYGQFRDWDVTKVTDSTNTLPAPVPNAAPPTVVANQYGNATLAWTVKVTNLGLKGADAKDEKGAGEYLKVAGYIEVTNTGSAPTNIGNIVVNLQGKDTAGKYKTISTDAADATNGDLSTQKSIGVWVVRGALSDPPSTVNPCHLFLNDASGALQFYDPKEAPETPKEWYLDKRKPALNAGESLKLLFTAMYDLKRIPSGIVPLPLTTGAQLRTEFIVTFDNAGQRSGTDIVAPNVDINNSGLTDPSESWVRSVPDRFMSFKLPEFIKCNETVNLYDYMKNDDPSSTATLTPKKFGDYDAINSETTPQLVLDGGTFPEGASNAQSYTVTADVKLQEIQGTPTPPESKFFDASFTNTAKLHNDGTSMVIAMPTPTPTVSPTPTPNQVTYSLPCCPGIDKSSFATWLVKGPPQEGGGGGGGGDNDASGFTTYTKGGWFSTPNGNNPGQLLADNFATLYSADLYLLVGHFPEFYLNFTSAYAVSQYPSGGGTAKALTANSTNPTESKGGVLGAQVLALQLNVDFSSAGISPFKTGFGGLIVTGTGTAGLDGKTVSEILELANQALGGVSTGYPISTLNNVVDELNNSFDNGTRQTTTIHLDDPNIPNP